MKGEKQNMNKLFTKIAKIFLGLSMAAGVGVAVSSKKQEAKSADALTASDISSSPVSSVTAGKKYVIASSTNATTAPSGSQFLAAKASNTWGTAVAIGSAYEFTAEGSGTSGFYLKCKDGYLAPKTGTSNSFLQYASSTSNAVKLQLKNTYELFSNTNAHYNLRQNGASGFRWYGTASADGTTGTAARLYEVSEGVAVTGVTLNKNALTLTVGESETLTATVAPNDATDKSVTWSSSKPSVALATNGTISAKSAGTATITVTTTDGGFTDTCAVTVNAPSTPSISLSGASFTGYTGQAFSVTATYANLTSDFAWSTSGAGTTTETITSTGDKRDGTSTYSGTLTGAGIKTISATGGGASSQSYTVDITKTTVDITKASTSIPKGRSETLAASHNASSVGGLNWTSGDNSIATVDSSGKVTVASGATVGATVSITATSSVDSGVSDTCTVTVAEAPLDTTYDFVTNFSSYNTGWTNSYGEHTDINGKTQVGGDYAATIDLYYASKQTGTITDRPVIASKTGSGSWAKVVGFTLTESGYKIGDVSVTFSQWGTKTPDIALFSGDSASGTPLDSGTIGTKNTISTTGLNATSFTVGYCDKNTGSNVQGGLTSIYITLVKQNALDHVTVSFDSDPADRTFYAGSNFAFNGTLTASYTVDSPKAVTPASYHLNSEDGQAITTSTVLNISNHNGKSVYVVYTEGGVSKSDSFTLIVNPAPATSVSLSSAVGSVGLNETFEVSIITATVQPSAYATQGVTWEVYDADGLVLDSTYFFDGADFRATQPADVVFHVKANSNGSVYAEFTLTVTGDPIVHLFNSSDVDVTEGSATVFGDVGDISYHVTTENFEGSMSYTWSSSNDSIISIDSDNGTSCDFYVEGVGGLARLSCRVQGSIKGDVTVYIDVTVTAVTVTSVTWTAPSIDVYSGTSLSSTSGWNIKYSTNSGKTDQTPDSFNVKLGGSTISLPHTWVAADDGKTLCVEVGGVSSSTTTVAVTQSINAVTATLTESWDHTFTEKAWSSAGDWTISEKLWNMSGTDDGSPYFGYDANKGQQFGSGSHPFSDVSLQSSAFSGTVDSVTVYTSGASSINATVQVSVGGTAYGSAQTITNTNTAYTFDLGGKSGSISIDYVNSSSKAIYVKEIVVNTVSGSENIANNASHKAAQRAAVAFANAFNAAMDDTENCTTGLDAAWATCSSAYTSFKNAAAALGTTEEAYALNLVKYATAQYSDDSGEACLERMMKTYEICVQKHEKTAFMSDLVTLGAPQVSPLVNIIGENTNTVAIIVIISMVSVTAIGGYFFLRRRKENI